MSARSSSEILSESEQRYRELANSLPHIVYESDTSGKLVFVNEKALEIAGYSKEDFEKGLNILQFIVPEDRQRAIERMQQLLAGGRYVPAEYEFLRKDGTTFPALITTTLRISKNKVTGLRGLVIDITERKKTKESLEKEQQELNCIIHSSPIIIFYKDKEGKEFVLMKPLQTRLKRLKKNWWVKQFLTFTLPRLREAWQMTT